MRQRNISLRKESFFLNSYKINVKETNRLQMALVLGTLLQFQENQQRKGRIKIEKQKGEPTLLINSCIKKMS